MAVLDEHVEPVEVEYQPRDFVNVRGYRGLFEPRVLLHAMPMLEHASIVTRENPEAFFEPSSHSTRASRAEPFAGL